MSRHVAHHRLAELRERGALIGESSSQRAGTDREPIVAMLIVAAMVLWHTLSLRAAKPWYERDGVVDHE